jgi:SSS family solute:Na+ symporter
MTLAGLVGASVVVATVSPIEITVFVVLFVAIGTLGMYASHWRRGNLANLDEWGLAGRRFGPVVTWFLQGGSIYTTYSFIAVPALVFGAGSIGFYAMPYLVLAYLVLYLFVPKLWRQAKESGYVTGADYVKARFSSRTLSIVIALTGILSMIPYVALQVYGIELCLSEIGMPVEASLLVATAVLALITYVSGLRAAALIAMAKDVLIWTTVFVAITYIPLRLGGYVHVFHMIPHAKLVLPSSEYAAFSTLAVGSGFALYLYPHSLTGSMSSTSERVVRSNAATLPIYTIMLGMLAMLGYMAIAAGLHPSHTYGDNIALPALFQHMFPAPFAGFALAAIAIGGLVPASVMSIAAGSLFGRNVYTEIRQALASRREMNPRKPGLAEPTLAPEQVQASGHRPGSTTHQETLASKLASFSIKFLAVGFILAVPTTFVINFQLAGGVWILQTLAAILLAPFIRWLRTWPVLAGWAAGMAWGTYLLFKVRFAASTYPFSIFGHHVSMYIGVPAVILNLIIALGASAIACLAKGVRTAPATERAKRRRELAGASFLRRAEKLDAAVNRPEMKTSASQD